MVLKIPRTIYFYILLSFNLFLMTHCQADFLWAQISRKDAPLRSEPKASGSVLEMISQGEVIKVAGEPKNGFYLAKANSGNRGWILAKSVKVKSYYLPKGSASSNSNGNVSEESVAGIGSSGSDAKAKSFTFFGGMRYFSVGNSATQSGSPGTGGTTSSTSDSDLNLKSGLGFGAEVGVPFGSSGKMNFLGRIETFSKSASVTEKTTNVMTKVGVSSLPIMGGVGYDLWRSGKMSAQGAVLLGVAPFTKFSSEVANLSVSESKMGLTALGRVNGEYQVLSNMSGVLELGYRYLKTGSGSSSKEGENTNGTVTPPPTGATTTSTTTDSSINLSGVFFSLGAKLYF